MKPKRPILCLDFDGTVTDHSNHWQGPAITADPPSPGAMEFIHDAVDHFEVHIFSSRSGLPGGINAMRSYMLKFLALKFGDELGPVVYRKLHFPTDKPPATVSIDDRAITFTGTWPSITELKSFKPWHETEIV